MLTCQKNTLSQRNQNSKNKRYQYFTLELVNVMTDREIINDDELDNVDNDYI